MRLRWMIKYDLDRVMEVQEQSHMEVVPRSILCRWLRESKVIGMVAEQEDYQGRKDFPVIAGYLIYEVNRCSINIRHFRVSPEHQWKGVGRFMMDQLKRKLNEVRKVIRVCIPERDLTAQLFLKACDFRAVSIERDWRNDEDGYRFEFLGSDDLAANKFFNLDRHSI